jgi:Pyruvate/2-oxoacid:ferredoxin oxidoreductase delta subunit
MYALPPIQMILNHHQFREEIGPDDLAAAELYQQFFIRDGFYRFYESSVKGTQIMRVIPVKQTVRQGQQILDTEEAHKIIDAVEHLRLVPCPCRTRTEKLGVRECKDKFPIADCIMMETSAQYFELLDIGKKVTADEAKLYFDEMQGLGLVGTTENYEAAGHTVICLCCDCCCSQLRGRTRWENPDAVAPSNFVAESNEDCAMCGECVERCFFKAIRLDEENGRAIVDGDKCMGCGVCTLACAQDAMRLKRLEREMPYLGPRELFKKIARENRGEVE